jgi:carboxylesterase type B
MQDSPAAGETFRRASLDSPQARHVKSAYPRKDALQIRLACHEPDTFELFKEIADAGADGERCEARATAISDQSA